MLEARNTTEKLIVFLSSQICIIVQEITKSACDYYFKADMKNWYFDIS